MPEPGSLLAVDCGTAMTKAVLFDRAGGQPRVVARGVAPTNPQDLAEGFRAAVERVAAASGRPVPGAAVVTVPGGSLLAAVVGVVREISAESALRAALNAGASVVDLLAIDDRRLPHEKIRALKQCPLDLVVLAGGVDEGLMGYGSGRQVVTMADLVRRGLPRPRFDPAAPVPVVFAGSLEARDLIREVFEGPNGDGVRGELVFTENVRPEMEAENLEPAVDTILALFGRQIAPRLAHTRGLAELAGERLLPAPLAVGEVARWLARAWEGNLLVLDLGAAGADVHSVIDGGYVRSRFEPEVEPAARTSEAVSYAASPLSAEAVAEWLPYPADLHAVDNWLGNRELRPLGVPESWPELWLEHARRRELLRGALLGHQRVARALKGVLRAADLGERLRAVFGLERRPLLDLLHVDAVVGTGGGLTDADPRQAGLLLLDAAQPAGLTFLALDAQGIMGHLGALAAAFPADAETVLAGEWLTALGTCVAPVKRGVWDWVRPGSRLASVILRRGPGGGEARTSLVAGSLKRLALAPGEVGQLEIRPARDQDFGAGPGQRVRAEVAGGVLGVILDGRGRPLVLGAGEHRAERIREWCLAMEAYPESSLSSFESFARARGA